MCELVQILQYIGNGGLAIVIFIIWYITYRQSSRQVQEMLELHSQIEQRMIRAIEEDQQWKEILAGILSRLEVKLETPAQCPIIKERSG